MRNTAHHEHVAKVEGLLHETTHVGASQVVVEAVRVHEQPCIKRTELSLDLREMHVRGLYFKIEVESLVIKLRIPA